MTVRRTLSALALLGVAAMLCIAALTPIRSSEIISLDAEARRLGVLWTEDQSNEALAVESNTFYNAARDLEPPLEPIVALGIAMLLAAVAVAVWPKSIPESTQAPDAEGVHADGSVDSEQVR